MTSPKMNQSDVQLQRHIQKEEKHDRRTEYIFGRILHWMERVIAVITLLALAGNLILECWTFAMNPGRLSDLSHILHSMLGIVVGLEFVRMLIDTTPANVIEVLVLAITRYVVLAHEDPWSNFVSIACIAGLFAVRRFLIRPDELKEDLVEEE